MKSIIHILFCAPVIVVAGLAATPWPAGAAATNAASTTNPVATTPARADKPLRATLDNGLRVVIVPNHLAPVVTTVMNYHVGSNEAPKGFPGMAHAQEHMMFRGSPGLSAGQLSAIAAAMGGRFNADTQQAVTQYFFTVPSRFLDVALHIESLRMQDVLDSQSLWAKERGAIEQEVARDLSSPGYRVYTKILAHLFQGTPYAHDALGTKPSFDKTTGEMLHQFYDQWYAPNNATLVIAGDVDPAQALTRVKQLLGPIKARPLPERPQFQLSPIQPATIRTSTDQPNGTVLLAFRMPGYASDDYAATQVLAQVLSNQRSTLYNQLVPKGRALDTGFDLNGMRPASIGLALAAFPQGGQADALLDKMRAILQSVAQHGVAADLVRAAKRQAVTQAQARRGSIAGQAMLWSQALVVEQRHSPHDAIRAIEGVTVKDVDRVARRYLDADHAVVAILTPEGSGQASHAGGFGGKESFTPAHVGAVELPSWATHALATITLPVSRLHPSDIYLRNGLRLIVQPESASPVVHVYGHIKNRPGLSTAAGEEGVHRVLDRLLNYGTTSLDRMAFHKALDDIGASASTGSDFSLLVQSEHIKRGVQLLADAELHPALPEQAFAVVRRQVAGSMVGELTSPGFKMQQAVGHALYPDGDPTLRHPTAATVSGLTLDQVRAYYHKTFRPDLCTIVMVGDITPLQAVQIVRRNFGHWQATGPTPDMTLPAVPLNKAHTAVVPDHARVQDKVTLAETLGIDRAHPAYYPLVLGNQVLSGGFYASRLYRELREQRGLVYYIGATIDAGKNRADFHITYGAEPGDVDTAHALISRALHTMQTTTVTKQELHRAKAELIRQVPLHEASETAIAGGLLARASKDLPLDEPIRAAHRYLQLDAKDIRNAYKQWIRPDDFVQVSQGPTPQSP